MMYDDVQTEPVTDMYYNPDCVEVELKYGMRFKSHVVFREAVRRYAVEKSALLKHLYNEPRRQRFDCVGPETGNCPWTVRASKESQDGSFRIKKICFTHRCYMTPDVRASSNFLAQHFRKRVHETPFYKCKDMMTDAYKELKLNVKWDTCVRAKNKIVKELEGNFKDEYAHVIRYAKYLESINPNNTIKVVTIREGGMEGPSKF